MTLILVTGGAGFVGKRLVSRLRGSGHEVRVLDLAEGDQGAIRGSVTDPAVAARAVEGVDTVYHLAGVAHLWMRDASVYEHANVVGTQVMLEAAKRAHVKRFVHCSSLTTLVGRRTPIGASKADESIEIPPAEMLGPYPRSKRLADLAVLAAANEGLDAVIAMPTEPIGAGDDSMTPPTTMILDFANGRTPAYIDCTLNFVPVESLAEGFIAVAQKGRQGERYLLGGENVSMRRLLDTIGRLTGRRMPDLVLPYGVALAAGLIDTCVMSALTGKAPKAPLTGVRLAGRSVQFDVDKADAALGWRAGPFEPALAAMLDWARSTGRLHG